MNFGIAAFLLASLMCGRANAASLLRPTAFPKTANDLTFTQNLQLQTAGYEPWETIYDNSGRCVSGCTYAGITVQEQNRIINENTNAMYQHLAQYAQTHQNELTPAQFHAIQNILTPGDSAAAAQWAPSPQPARCSPNNPAIPAGQRIPVGEPLIGTPRITSPFGSRIHPITGELSGHNGIDFSAPVGTTVFTPANGTVAAVWTDATCGNGLRITHTDGYETLYCHLSRVTVSKGDQVEAGCSVAETGNTGRSTGPHLHYGIKYNGIYTNPAGLLGRKG